MILSRLGAWGAFHFRFVSLEIFIVELKRSLPYRQMVSFSFRNLIAISLLDQKVYVMTYKANKKKTRRPAPFKSTIIEMAFFCKWNVNSARIQPVEKEKAVRRTSQVGPFVPKKSRFIRASHWYFNKLNGKFFLNRKLAFAAGDHSIHGRHRSNEILLGTRFSYQ